MEFFAWRRTTAALRVWHCSHVTLVHLSACSQAQHCPACGTFLAVRAEHDASLLSHHRSSHVVDARVSAQLHASDSVQTELQQLERESAQLQEHASAQGVAIARLEARDAEIIARHDPTGEACLEFKHCVRLKRIGAAPFSLSQPKPRRPTTAGREDSAAAVAPTSDSTGLK